MEDALVKFLILAALGWSARHRARAGIVLAGILLVPGLATLSTAWEKFNSQPDPLPLSIAGAGALAVNLSCAFMLARYRATGAVSCGRLSCRPATTRSPISPSSGGNGLPVAFRVVGFDCRAGGSPS